MVLKRKSVPSIHIRCMMTASFLVSATFEELASWHERNETWRRLKAVFPAGVGALAREQIFYFDRNGLQRRADYAAIDTEGTPIAQYSWAHRTFSGIVVPTLHRGLLLQPDGTVVRSPPRLDVEISDAQFE